MSETSYSENAPKPYETSAVPPPKPWTLTTWLIVIIACIGFAYDTYALLVMPLGGPPALAHLLPADRNTDAGGKAIAYWNGIITLASAVCGGVFGLLGGWLTDRFGRARVLTWSILIYAVSALATGFSTSLWMFLVLRCTTFIGVCVEFVAAVAWLAELFPNPRQRERVLGYTQAFASLGGLMVSGVYLILNQLVGVLPAIYGDPDQTLWRYTFISGVLPAVPLLIVRPFLPESPVWKQKKEQGTLRRPSLFELFRPSYRRTSLLTAVLFACGFLIAFGSLQMTPQMTPGLFPDLGKQIGGARKQYEAAKAANADPAKTKELAEHLEGLRKQMEGQVGGVQFLQEIGGLAGRFALAFLALRIVSRRLLLQCFLLPALVIIPLVYFFPAAGRLPQYNVELLKVGIFVAGFLTIAQFSFWGNYLPRMYPTYLRGTGESFAANVGGRMVGASGQLLTPLVQLHIVLALLPGLSSFTSLAYAAASVTLVVCLLALVVSFWLPQPREEVAQE